jgi:hypothetical protein
MCAPGNGCEERCNSLELKSGEKGCAQMESGNGARHIRPRRALVKWGVALALLAVLVVGSLFVRSTILTAHADAYTGCHGVQQATASTSANGYILTVSTIAQYGNGGEWGKGYCGSIKTSATMTVPANGVGGTLVVTLVGDTTGSKSNTYTFPNAGSSSYTFTEYSPSAGPKCAYGTASFTITGGATLTATTNSKCPK